LPRLSPSSPLILRVCFSKQNSGEGGVNNDVKSDSERIVEWFDLSQKFIFDCWKILF
jgi:hypothetical protein